MIKVGIIGANGYLGIELIRILSMHPNVKLSKIFQRELSIDEEFPHLQSLNLKDIQTENLDDKLLIISGPVTNNISAYKQSIDKFSIPNSDFLNIYNSTNHVNVFAKIINRINND